MSENLDPQTGRAADLPGVIRARIRQAVSARPLAATAWVVAGVGLGILLTTLVLKDVQVHSCRYCLPCLTDKIDTTRPVFLLI